MAFLFNWMKKGPVAPPRVASDKVVPLGYFDDCKVNRSLCLDCSMKFEHVMDVEKLICALERLLERPGWRKLGARLRLNSDGKLEYHIPAQYTKERRAVHFTHAKHDIPIYQHPIGSKLPTVTDSVKVSPDLRPFRSLLVPEDGPSVIEDWLYSDRAQLGVHIVSFTDATLVTLTWMHTLLDAMSQHKILRAWTAILEGRDHDVPDFYGEDFDPLESLGEPSNASSKIQDARNVKEEEYVLADKKMTAWKTFRFAVNLLWDTLLHPTEQARSTILPAACFQVLKAQALQDLSSIPPSTLVTHTSDPSKPFLSDGDVLCAWWIRHLVTAQPAFSRFSPQKTLQIMNVLDMRDILTNTTPSLIRPKTEFIGNCNTTINSFFTLSEFVSLPLGAIAARIRSDLVRQTTRPQVNANLRLVRAALRKTGYQPLYGEGDMFHCTFSNWTKGDVFNTDFGAAVISGKDGGVGAGKSVVARPIYVQTDGRAHGVSVRNTGVCLGRDAEGNWWMESIMRPEAWAILERAVEGLK